MQSCKATQMQGLSLLLNTGSRKRSSASDGACSRPGASHGARLECFTCRHSAQRLAVLAINATRHTARGRLSADHAPSCCITKSPSSSRPSASTTGSGSLPEASRLPAGLHSSLLSAAREFSPVEVLLVQVCSAWRAVIDDGILAASPQRLQHSTLQRWRALAKLDLARVDLTQVLAPLFGCVQCCQDGLSFGH